jgi:glucose/arabinose dehydrogenase
MKRRYRNRSLAKGGVRGSSRRLRVEALEPRLLLAGDTYLINFQLAGAPVPTRYAADTGELYGDRGGGLFYGWSSDHTDVSRDRGLQADQRLDTLIHFHQDQNWEFALPNGTYAVTVSIGDPQYASTHTLNVEGVNYWNAVALTPNSFLTATQQITVSDGQLTLNQGAATDKATRIDFIHIVGLPNGPNTAPETPTVTQPVLDGQVVNPGDVHMEAIGFSDGDGDEHKSSDWEIWSTGPGAQVVWQTLGITGVELVHTHLGDGVFINSHAGRGDLLPNTDFELRVRFRDDAGSVSTYATRTFHSGAASTVFPLELQDVRTVPAPRLFDAFDDVILPAASPIHSELRLESAAGELLLSMVGLNGNSNNVTNPPALGDHADLRIVLTAGSDGLVLGQTNLSFRDDHGQDHTVFLPALNLAAEERLDLWVSSSGATYYGLAAQTVPDFSVLAQQADLLVPYLSGEPGFFVEEVAGGFKLPTNIAFVPNPGPNPDDPLFYVTELYGTIKVVTRDFSVSDYATNLLNFNPTGSFPGSGEQGLTGILVDPLSGDVFATRVTATNPANPNGAHHPQVLRFHSNDGGLTAAGPPTVILNMVGETQGQSHQISNISIGPDGKLYVHMGDGFDSSKGQDLNSFRGKVLRMNLDGSAPSDNPFYSAANGITATDYVFAYGLRNPFGGAWRASDGNHYEVENGPNVDRFARIDEGVNYLYDGSDGSMFNRALYVWNPAHAPVNITFVEPETFNGSQLPASLQDHAFVSESGPTVGIGPQAKGKRIVEFVLDANGDNLIGGPTTLVDYVGDGAGSVVGLTAGPDGLYFTGLYNDAAKSQDPAGVALAVSPGAKIYRVRYINPLAGDYDIDGDVDEDDFLVWRSTFGSNYLLAADGNGNGVIDAADYTVWRDALESFPGQGAGAATVAAISGEVSSPREDSHSLALEEIVTGNAANVAGVAPPTGTSVVYAKTRPRATFDRVTPASSTSPRDNLLSAWVAARADKHDRRDGPKVRPIDDSDVGETDSSPHCGIDAVFGLWGADRWHRGLF